MDGKAGKPLAMGQVTGSGRKQKPLIDAADPLRSLKRVLDSMLVQSNGIPSDIRQTLIAARDAAWEEFKKAEEAQMVRTR